MAKDVKTTDKMVTDQLPDYLREMKGGMGTEGLSSNAISPPRLKLIQALSPELEDYPDLKAGEFFNSVTGASYGSMVRIIPCYMNEAYFLFAPRVPGVNGGLLARAIDGVHWSPPNTTFEVTLDKKGRKGIWKTTDTVARSGLDAWGTSDPEDRNSPPAATHALNAVVLLPDHLDDGPSVLSFVRSALKVGKKFAGNLKMSRVPSFGRVFELSSMKVEGPSGPYFEPRVRAAGFVGDVNVFKMAEDIYQMARERGVDVDVSSEAEAEPSSGRMSSGGDTGAGDDKVPF